MTQDAFLITHCKGYKKMKKIITIETEIEVEIPDNKIDQILKDFIEFLSIWKNEGLC